LVYHIGSENADIELGYWAIRGLAQPIRFLLAYVEVSFSEVRIGATPDGNLITDKTDESADWEQHKSNIDFSFPNIPYLVDKTGSGTVRLTQSNAIMRHLGRRFNLYGQDDLQRAAIDMLQDEAYDFRNTIIDTCYVDATEFAESLNNFKINSIPRYVDRFEHYLATSSTSAWFVADSISFVDFILYELIWQTSVMVPGSISKQTRPNLFSFLESFESLPQIQKYMAGADYLRHPINSSWTPFTWLPD
jgi:glutathione S-transferase